MKHLFKSLIAANMLLGAGLFSNTANADAITATLSGGLNTSNYPGYVIPGTFSLTFSNPTGPALPAGSVRIKAVLPTGIQFTSYTPPAGWTYTIVPSTGGTNVTLINTSSIIGVGLLDPSSTVIFTIPLQTTAPVGAGNNYTAFVEGTGPFFTTPSPTQNNNPQGPVQVANSPLPVLFKDFTVTAEGCKAVLTWSTAVEKNNSHFEIERSQNGTEFRSIGSTNGAGTSFEVNSYTYVDEKPENLTNFYRIRQVDFDKKSTTSTVENAKFDCKVSGISVYPNPTSDVVYVKGLTDKGSIKIYNMVGQLVIDKKVENSLEGINMSSLAEGTYQIQVFSGDKSVFNTKLIKR